MACSYNQLSTWERCPQQRRFYLDNTPQTENPLLQAGALSHHIFDAYFRHCAAEGVPTDISALPMIARACYISTLSTYRTKGQQYLTDAQYQELMATLVTPFSETHMVPGDVINTEERMAIDWNCQTVEWDSPKAWFRGILDLLCCSSDAAEATDYKTGYANTADVLQGEIYAWLVFASYPHINSVSVIWDFVRYNVQRAVGWTRDDYTAIDSKVRAMVQAMEADTDLLPTPGHACATCGWASMCPAKPETVEAIESIDAAKTAVETIALLTRDLDAVKDALRQWCVNHGNVTHNGLEWGFHSVGGPGFHDAREFVGVLQAANVDPYPFLTVNNVKAKKLRRQFGHILTSTPTVQFKCRKAGEIET